MIDESLLKPLFGAIVARLENPDGEFVSAKQLYNAGVGAGLDMKDADPERRAPTLKAMYQSFEKLSPADQYRSISSLAKRLIDSGPTNLEATINILYERGCAWDGNKIVAAGVLDERERRFLPLTSAEDIGKSFDRLSRGDESGAISAACGAVDLATGAAYEKFKLGDPGKVSFSAKINTALEASKVFQDMKAEFRTIGMNEEDAQRVMESFQQIVNHTGQSLQILRKRMGDVHGSRPALRGTAYDCIKLASAICALFEGKV